MLDVAVLISYDTSIISNDRNSSGIVGAQGGLVSEKAWPLVDECSSGADRLN